MTPSPTVSAPASTAPSASAATVLVDPDLLDVLPAAPPGVTLTFDPQTSADVAAEPGLAEDVESLAIGLYASAGTASVGPDLAIVNVVRLRDPAEDDDWFRDWRDSYDDAACANAGGVERRAETILGGRTFFVASCGGGAFTYHVRVGDGGSVISLTSIGPGRLGEELARRIAG